jgi:hypothetical protein
VRVKCKGACPFAEDTNMNKRISTKIVEEPKIFNTKNIKKVETQKNVQKNSREIYPKN